jgi:hypothetical protein
MGNETIELLQDARPRCVFDGKLYDICRWYTPTGTELHDSIRGSENICTVSGNGASRGSNNKGARVLMGYLV